MSGVPVIYDGNDAEAAKVISERAQELGSPYYEVKREDAEILRNTMSGIDFSFKNEYYGNTTFSIPVYSKVQVMNQYACAENNRGYEESYFCI